METTVRPLEHLWLALREEEVRACTSGTLADAHYVVVSRNGGGGSVTEHARRASDVLESALLNSIAVAAYDNGFSVSTVTQIVNRRLGQFGLPGRLSQVPFVVVAAVVATARNSGASGAWVTTPDQTVVSLSRAESDLSSPPAELAMLSHIVQGRSYSEISQLRHKTTRTIANQVASAYRTLRISGRLELLRFLSAKAVPAPLAPYQLTQLLQESHPPTWKGHT